MCALSLIAASSGLPACSFWDMGSWSDAVGNDDAGRCGASGYAEVVLHDVPLGYWRLDEAPGAMTAADCSGNHKDAMVSGNVSFGS
jgi:hypothetical protein